MGTMYTGQGCKLVFIKSLLLKMPIGTPNPCWDSYYREESVKQIPSIKIKRKETFPLPRL